MVAAGVEIGLEVVRIALAGVSAVAGGEGVSEADDEGSGILRSGQGWSWSSGERGWGAGVVEDWVGGRTTDAGVFA